MQAPRLQAEPLTREAFATFGDVIEIGGRAHHTINQGHAERYHDLARVDVTRDGGHPLINIFRANPWPNPIRIQTMERHPLSSQAFVPLMSMPFLIVVAAPTERLRPEHLRAFVANGHQGVNYHRAVWHHALLALTPNADFLVIDRGGAEANCDEVQFEDIEIFLDHSFPRA